MEDGLLSKIGAFFKKIIGFFTGIFKKIFGFSKMAKAGAKDLDGKIDIANMKPNAWIETNVTASKLRFVNKSKVSIEDIQADFDRASTLLDDHESFLSLVSLECTKEAKNNRATPMRYAIEQLTKQKGFEFSEVAFDNAKLVLPKVTFSQEVDGVINVYLQKRDFKPVAKALQDMANGLGDIEKKIDLSLKSLKNNEKLTAEMLTRNSDVTDTVKTLYGNRMMTISKEYNHLSSLASTLVMGILGLVNHYNDLIK